jgi:hypothetical protein
MRTRCYARALAKTLRAAYTRSNCFDKIFEGGSAMPAQLVVIAKDLKGSDQDGSDKDQEKDKDEKSANPEETGSSEEKKKTRWPKHRRVPIGMMVLGQDADDRGHFRDVSALMQSLRGYAIGPGKSNTVFATVDDIAGVEQGGLERDLAALPSELTIIIGEGKTDGGR